MKGLKQQTIDTYNNSAEALAAYFGGIGPRVDDIERAFQLASDPSAARVVELGCGDGRDAQEIIKRCAWYEGSDVSVELLKIAQAKNPGTHFSCVDMINYEFPQNLDVIFAFASLLHLDKNELKIILDRGRSALKIGGIFYISTKWAPQYQEFIKEDEYGKRLFFLYDEQTLLTAAGERYEPLYDNRRTIGKTEWLELALQKKAKS